MRPVRERDEHRGERSPLRNYVEHVFLPRLLADGMSKSHVERHAAALEYVERFIKQPLSPGDIDSELVLNFEAWLWRQQISDSRRRDLVESLRRIAAAYTPDKRKLRANRRNRRVLPAPPEGTLRHYYETIYVPIALVGRTGRYVDENRAALWRLFEHYGRDVSLSECGDRLLSDHVGYLLDLSLKPATINTGHLAVLLAILRDAHRRGFIDQPPTIRKLPTTQNEPDAWSRDEIAAFIAACPAASPRPIAGIDAGYWWQALVRIVWYSGLRRRAILAIQRDPPAVDLQTGWLRVPGSSMKNRRGQQYRLGLDALESIARIWQPRRKLLLPFPLHKTTFYLQFHRIREAAGLPRSTSNTGCLHKLRRSTATATAAKVGVGAAQDLLGHSSRLTTKRYIDQSKMPGADLTEILGPIGELELRADAAG